MDSFFGKIFLASHSPRRRQLLSEAGFDVEVLVGIDVDETYPSHLSPCEIPLYLSKLKLSPYLTDGFADTLVTADTLVFLGDRVLGKPDSKEHAVEILESLMGEWHTVITGVSLLYNGKVYSFAEATKVKFASLARPLIEHYVETYSPMDKAGAYGIQEWIGLIGVEKIEGDFYNIMGFPVCRFVELYRQLNDGAIQKTL